MSSFGKRIDGPVGRRKAVREEVVLAGSAQTLESSRSVVVTDVSVTGAKLVGRELPPRASNVLISVGDVELFATVAWSGRDECGVTFDPPLDPDMVHQVKHDGCWSKVMGVPGAH